MALLFVVADSKYIDCGLDLPGLRITGSFTLEAWIYRISSSAGYMGIMHDVDPGWSTGYSIQLYNNCLSGVSCHRYGTPPAIEEINSATIVTANVWHHIAVVYDSSTNLCYLYLDGVDVSPASHTMYNPDTHAEQQCCMGSTNGIAEFFGGRIEEVRVWNVARTLEQIKVDMYRRMIPDGNNIKALWRLDEGKINDGPGGTTAVDISGNDNNGDDYGGFANSSYVDGAPIISLHD